MRNENDSGDNHLAVADLKSKHVRAALSSDCTTCFFVRGSRPIPEPLYIVLAGADQQLVDGRTCKYTF